MSDGVVPPANKPRVREEQEAFCAIAVDKFQKLYLSNELLVAKPSLSIFKIICDDFKLKPYEMSKL